MAIRVFFLKRTSSKSTRLISSFGVPLKFWTWSGWWASGRFFSVIKIFWVWMINECYFFEMLTYREKNACILFHKRCRVTNKNGPSARFKRVCDREGDVGCLTHFKLLPKFERLPTKKLVSLYSAFPNCYLPLPLATKKELFTSETMMATRSPLTFRDFTS